MPAYRPMVFYGRAHSAGSAQCPADINVQGPGGDTSACRLICSFMLVPLVPHLSELVAGRYLAALTLAVTARGQELARPHTTPWLCT